jgi:molecular chaperone HtpG
LTDSVACLVAAEDGPDRQLEKLLTGTGRLAPGAKPILEVNTRHDIVLAVAALSDSDRELKEDVAHLLLDEARVLEGDRPLDAKHFCDRLARLMRRGLAGRTHT